MYPNIIIGNLLIPCWHAMLFLGIIIAVALSIYCRPKDFEFSQRETLQVAILAAAASVLGARLLFLILHYGTSEKGGFAYFGALILFITTLWIYCILKKKSFLALIDYGIAFLILTQIFVRLGCFLTGCCYGRATNSTFGLIFKTIDNQPRHPAQAYMVIVLVAIYLLSRVIYERKKNMIGFTFFVTLILYGLMRFFIEFIRVDSPEVFLNITLAQVASLLLSFVAALFLRRLTLINKS